MGTKWRRGSCEIDGLHLSPEPPAALLHNLSHCSDDLCNRPSRRCLSFTKYRWWKDYAVYFCATRNASNFGLLARKSFEFDIEAKKSADFLSYSCVRHHSTRFIPSSTNFKVSSLFNDSGWYLNCQLRFHCQYTPPFTTNSRFPWMGPSNLSRRLTKIPSNEQAEKRTTNFSRLETRPFCVLIRWTSVGYRFSLDKDALDNQQNEQQTDDSRNKV